MASYTYIGNELTVFKHAYQWRSYFKTFLVPFLGSNILEVGAGIGTVTKALCEGHQQRWVCLEPDKTLTSQLLLAHRNGDLPSCCEIICGTIQSLSISYIFDTIIYIDVLEHIFDHSKELCFAADKLEKDGHLILLSPAFNFLFSKFDNSVGHYRRYSANSLAVLTPPNLKLLKMHYLDSIGFFLSLANKFFFKACTPTNRQIVVWDSIGIPISKFLDRFLRYSLGKSIISIWIKL